MKTLYQGSYKAEPNKSFTLNYNDYINFNEIVYIDSENYIGLNDVIGLVFQTPDVLSVISSCTIDVNNIIFTSNSSPNVGNSSDGGYIFSSSGNFSNVSDKFYNVLYNAEKNYITLNELGTYYNGKFYGFELTLKNEASPNDYCECSIINNNGDIIKNWGEVYYYSTIYLNDNGKYFIKTRSKVTHREFEPIAIEVTTATGDTILSDNVDENGRYILAKTKTDATPDVVSFMIDGSLVQEPSYRDREYICAKFYIRQEDLYTHIKMKSKISIEDYNLSLIHSTWSETILLEDINANIEISFNKYTGIIKATAPEYYAKEYILYKNGEEYARNATGSFQIRESGTYFVAGISPETIILANSNEITVVALLDAPDLDIIYNEPNQLGWVDDPNANSYEIYKDGKLYKTINTSNVQTYALRRTVQKIMFEVIE